MSVSLEKQALRAQVLAARAGMTAEQLLAAADALLSRLSLLLDGYEPTVVTCYVPVGSEPGGPALPDRVAAALPGASLLLPVLLADLDLDWAAYTGPDGLQMTSRRLYEPTGPLLGVSAVSSADVMIVPALAVDRDGFRLGRGGGSYDRALARARPDTVTIALLHDGELVPCVPREPHDLPVRHALTPSAG